MQFIINTLFPELYTNFLLTSLIKRGINNNLISFLLQDMFHFADQHKRIDKKCVGHGTGMILDPLVIEKIYENGCNIAQNKLYSIFFSPHGKKMDQDTVKRIYQKVSSENYSLMLFGGRYEGFDARSEEVYADEILSIGDYVLCGGDLPIMVFCEALIRLIPGIVGKIESVINDSFYNSFLDYPHYTNPHIWRNIEIPKVLKSGNHNSITQWREEQSITRSIQNNWAWTKTHLNNQNSKNKVAKMLPNHYCVLLHNDVMLPHNMVGNSSVTSIDIHDLARSCATYGIKKYYIVTRLEAQQKIVTNFLSFWHSEETNSINASRAFALSSVTLCSEVDDAIADIEKNEKIKPITIVTSSRRGSQHKNFINYNEQGKIWKQKKPVLFIFGTAHGINPEIIKSFDYQLVPLEGLPEFNFLSVRAATAIILDRWLGIENKIIK